jgi:hypothetical protein
LATSACFLVLGGCEAPKTVPDNSTPSENSASIKVKSDPPKLSARTAGIEKRKQDFRQMEETMQGLASQAPAQKENGPEFKFILPSQDWQLAAHAGGSKKESVWLFSDKKLGAKMTGLKILVTGAGTKENPKFASTAQQVYDSSLKKHPEVTREWKVGNFTLRRSFIGFIDERHGEATLTAFGSDCTVELNIASESLDRDDLFKLADAAAEELIAKNPNGGYPKN